MLPAGGSAVRYFEVESLPPLGQQEIDVAVIDIRKPKIPVLKMPKTPALPPRMWAAVVGAVLVGWLLFSGLYTVPAESVGVVQRFGRYVANVDPGLHFKIPYGIDTVTLVPVKRQLKQEFGFATQGATYSHQSVGPSQWPLQTTMVTGDLNSARVEWVVQFRIESAYDFLFKVREPDECLRDVAEAVMREVVGDRTVDEVLTIGRQEIESAAQEKMQSVVNKYEMGLRIDQVQLKNVSPPKAVQASFDEVNEAQQERERMINVAKGEYNKAVPRTRGEADQRVQAAEGYAVQRVNEAEGDVARFDALLAEYLKAPDVTRRRLYLEALAEVLPRIKSKIIIDEAASSVLPLLQLQKPAAEQAPQP
jgi:membrane protease subunit HflK